MIERTGGVYFEKQFEQNFLFELHTKSNICLGMSCVFASGTHTPRDVCFFK